MNTLLEKYPQEIQKILAKYPVEEKRAAVMPLLYLAQRELNYITKQSLNEIAEIIGISPTDVGSIVGFYTLYHAEPEGKYRIQVCTDLPCALRGADEFMEKLCENLGIRVGGTTPDGLVTLEEVTCLAACNRAPMFQVQSGDGLTYHENQTVESTMALVEQWREQESQRIQEEQVEGTAVEYPTPEVASSEARSSGDMDHLQVPVLPIAEDGTTTLSPEERIKIMQQGGQ